MLSLSKYIPLIHSSDTPMSPAIGDIDLIGFYPSLSRDGAMVSGKPFDSNASVALITAEAFGQTSTKVSGFELVSIREPSFNSGFLCVRAGNGSRTTERYLRHLQGRDKVRRYECCVEPCSKHSCSLYVSHFKKDAITVTVNTESCSRTHFLMLPFDCSHINGSRCVLVPLAWSLPYVS